MRYNNQIYYRMGQKRRLRQAGGSRWSVIIKTFIFLMIAVCLALFYVWQNVQIVRLGYKIKEKERSVLELKKCSRAMEMDLSVLKMPSRIMSKIQEEQLNLRIPEIGQIVKIDEEPILYEEDMLDMNREYDNFGSSSLINLSKLND